MGDLNLKREWFRLDSSFGVMTTRATSKNMASRKHSGLMTTVRVIIFATKNMGTEAIFLEIKSKNRASGKHSGHSSQDNFTRDHFADRNMGTKAIFLEITSKKRASGKHSGHRSQDYITGDHFLTKNMGTDVLHRCLMNQVQSSTKTRNCHFNLVCVGQAVQNADLAGNVDDPEGSLDALMQVAMSTNVYLQYESFFGVVMFCPCLFCPSDNFESCLALPTR